MAPCRRCRSIKFSADLRDWKGDEGAHGWRKLCDSVAALTGRNEERDGAHGRQRGSQQVSVCVLPFANMSGEAEQGYFSDGITEDITTDL
jgi:adenylate cyclase